MATASGLAAATRREREEMLIMKFPLKPAWTPATKQSGRKTPLPMLSNIRALRRRNGLRGYTYVFSGGSLRVAGTA